MDTIVHEPPSSQFGPPTAPHLCDLGPLLLDAAGETLFHQNTPLPLGRRAVALLIRLVRQPGEIVSKDALMQAGWHNLAVEESNLATQISALRRVLAGAGGAGWIETSARRGYRFTGPAIWRGPATPAAQDQSGPPSVAVMPFALRDPALAEFAEGLAEDVVSMLAALRELVVLSRAATLAAHNRGADAIAAGRALGVRYIVSGAIRATTAGLRVTVELAECATGLAVWSRAFDTQAQDAPQAPAPIFALIVNTLAPRVREQELRRIQSRAPQDLTSHQLLLRARILMARHNRESFLQARALLDQAIANDPACAPAYELATTWHSQMISQTWTADRDRDIQAIEDNAQQSMALDGGNATALARAGHARALHHRDFAGARVLLDRALDAGPNVPKAWELSSCVLSWLGDGDGAVRHSERALQLSPGDPLAYQVHATLCLAHYTRGAHEAALAWTHRAHAEAPGPGIFMLYGVAAAAALGRLAEAGALLRLVLADHPRLSVAAIVSRHPYRDEERRIRYGEHLRLAGCPA